MAFDLANELREQDVELLFELQSAHAESTETCIRPAEDFIPLFTAHRKSIEVYLRTMLPTAADVDDVFQETSLVLWREFQSFTLGTNFVAWACKIAFNRVRAWRSRRTRETHQFSNTLAMEISDELISASEFYDARLLALSGCIRELKPHHRELLRRRYDLGESVETIADSMNLSLDAVYKMLSRIRQQLFESVTCQLNDSE